MHAFSDENLKKYTKNTMPKLFIFGFFHFARHYCKNPGETISRRFIICVNSVRRSAWFLIKNGEYISVGYEETTLDQTKKPLKSCRWGKDKRRAHTNFATTALSDIVSRLHILATTKSETGTDLKNKKYTWLLSGKAKRNMVWSPGILT